MTDPPPPRPTIADVARRAGVSTSSVSFAMNGLPGVGEDTRRRILRIARELGWQPSTSARALRRSRASAVGLVLARDPDELDLEGFFVRFIAGVQRTLTLHDCALMLQLIAPAARRVDLAPYERLVRARRVDGFLVADPQRHDPRYAMLAEWGVPAVVVGQPGRPCPLPVLETQHGVGMAAAVEHVLSLGHRRVGFVGGFEHYDYVRTRRRVWRTTLRRAGVQPGPSACATEDDPTGAAATARVLRDPFGVTAVTFTNDVLALTGTAVASQLGRSVPDDLSLTGFDDAAIATASGLTTVRVDYMGLGESAAAHLIAVISGEVPPPFEPASPQLVVRSSTRPPSGGEPSAPADRLTEPVSP